MTHLHVVEIVRKRRRIASALAACLISRGLGLIGARRLRDTSQAIGANASRQRARYDHPADQ